MIYAVRSDESTHRFVNHSLASLEPQDVNPFAMGEPSMTMKGTKVGYVTCFLPPFPFLLCFMINRVDVLLTFLVDYSLRFERGEAMEFISKNQAVFSEARDRAEKNETARHNLNQREQQRLSSPSPSA